MKHLSTDEIKRYEFLADQERKAGGTIHIHWSEGCPFIAIRLHNRKEIWIEDKKAEQKLRKIPETISAEDFLLAEAVEGRLT